MRLVHDDVGPEALKRRLLLMLAAVMLVLSAFTVTTPRASADEPTREPDLSVSVTASATLARTYSWSVEKVVDAQVRATTVDRTATFGYTVTARAGSATDSGWTLGGTVGVTSADAEGATVADVVVVPTTGGASSCTVTGGDDVVVPASGQVALPYTCVFGSAPSGTGTVTATLTWDPVGEDAVASADASAPVSFALTSETNKTVAVVDDQTVPGQRVVLDPSLAWAPGLVRTYTYDLALPGGAAPGLCVEHTNTASVDQPSGTDPTASATVRACAPEVLPSQAFGTATGSVRSTCRGTVRARVSNRTAETVTYRLRVGTKVLRIPVRSMGRKTIVTAGRASATVTLKVGSTRLDRTRIPQRCAAPVVLPDTGLRAARS